MNDLFLHACHHCNVVVVENLLKNGCNISILPNEERMKLLDNACHKGNVFVVEHLLAAGCNVNHTNANGCTPIIVAACKRYKNLMLALLEAGADVHVKDAEKRTVLHWACMMGLEEVVQVLIDRGGGVNEQDLHGYTPLSLAEHGGNRVISMQLLQAGASCDGLSNEQMNNLYRHAFNECDLLPIQTLLRNGFSLLGDDEEKLFYMGCREGDTFIVETVIANGCDVNCVDADGLTPLMVAAREGHEEVVKKLILAGAKVDLKRQRATLPFTLLPTVTTFNVGYSWLREEPV